MPIKLNGETSGSIELDVPAAVGSDLQLTLPATAGEVIVKEADGSVDLGDLVIDSSGRLLVGLSSSSQIATQILQGSSFGASDPGILYLARGTATPSASQTIGSIRFSDNTHVPSGVITAARDGGTWSATSKPTFLSFQTTADGASSSTERMRIKDNGSSNFFAANDTVATHTSASAGTSFVNFAGYHSATSTTNGTLSFLVFSNGNVVNTSNSYTGISDIKLKENIVDAFSQWNDIKDLRVRNFNFKEGQTHRQIGLVAQEVETVSPGLVFESPDRDEDNNDLGTVTKSVNYSVLYMKAVKALQEAMERIETLETKVAALEATP